MGAFDEKYWNLCQAAVWVEFRERELVEEFSEADDDAYRALHFYHKSMWPKGRKLHSSLGELHKALKRNSLRAIGYHRDAPHRLEEIGDIYWQDIDLRPPLAVDRRHPGRELWTNVKVKRADILRLWPVPEVKIDRSQFDWVAIREIYEELLSDGHAGSDRDLVLAIQDRFEKSFKTVPPARTTLQNKIKHWRAMAT